MNRKAIKYLVALIISSLIFFLFVFLLKDNIGLENSREFIMLTSIVFIATIAILGLFTKSLLHRENRDWGEIGMAKMMGFFKDMSSDSYSEIYNKIKSEDRCQCQFLNEEGGQCEILTSKKYKLFLDSECYGSSQWVIAHICSMHAKDLKR